MCSASLCKSLQGLDYVSSEGAKAFDDIAEVADKLGDNYQGRILLYKELIRKLKLVKRYLKGNYKVRIAIVCHHGRTGKILLGGGDGFFSRLGQYLSVIAN